MAEIPGIVYLIIGLGIAYISRKFDSLGLFFWIGILFIIIGTFKIIIWYISRKKKTKKEAQMNKPSLEPINPVQKKTPGKRQNNYPKYCPKCRLLYSQHSNFCSKCGSQLYIKP